MKTLPFPLLLLLLILCAAPAGPLRAEDEIEKAFRDALYAEEVKGDTEAALKAYQEVGQKFETQRDMAATALFRQGECLRKLGRKEEAAAIYKQVLAQYGDKERFARLSRENLATLGQPAPDAAPATAALPAGMTEEEAKELNRLKVLAQNSPDLLLVKGDGGDTPLEHAAREGHTEIVRWLLDKIPQRTPAMFSGPLNLAAANGHLKVCELLLDAGADVNKGAPLTDAVANKRYAVVRLLLARKADPNLAGTGSPPYNHAWDTKFRTQQNRPQSVSFFSPPLIPAASDNTMPPELITELIAAGADVNRTAEVAESGGSESHRYPETPLNAAVASRSAEKVRLLLAAKADANQKAGDLDSTPLLNAMMGTYPVAVKPGEPPRHDDEILSLLTVAGADWKARLSTGATALHIAARRGVSLWMDEALKAGLDVNAADKQGYMALHFAAEKGSLECIQKLLAAGAKVNAVTTDNWKYTPLSLACRSPRTDANLEILKILLEAKADPNVMGNSYPLSYLMDPGSPDYRWPEAAILLVEHGAKPKSAGILGGKAFELQRSSSQQSNVSDERLLAAFSAVWKAAHWRDNPRLSRALWLDDGEMRLRPGWIPAFTALFCDESGMSSVPSLRTFLRQAPRLFPRGTVGLRDWTRVAIKRAKDGKEEVIPVDLLALVENAADKAAPAGDGEFALQWGDAVSIPLSDKADEEATRRIAEWCQQDKNIRVRVELANHSLITNSSPAGDVDWTMEGRLHPESGILSASTADLLREAGIPYSLLNLTATIHRTQADGTMEILPPDNIHHGDIVVMLPPEPEAKLSEEALRSGIWLCQSMDGPFYPVAAQLTADSLAGVPLAGLVAALMAPHSLPFTHVAWEKANVKFFQNLPGKPNAEKEPVMQKVWVEKRLYDAWHDVKLVPGTVLILPHAEGDNFEPPANLRGAMTALTVNWNLAIGQQPLISSRWEPRFFRREGHNGTWLWRDLDPAKAGSPVLPDAIDLLAAHPRANDFTYNNGLANVKIGGHSNMTLTEGQTGMWLTGDLLTIEMPEARKPAARASQGVPPQPQSPQRKRVVLPTQGQ